MLQREQTIDGLTTGRVYRLKYSVRNALGWSEESQIASMLVAGVPAKPEKPTLAAVDAASMTLEFQEVLDNGGAVITGYELWARYVSDADFSQVAAYD